MNRFYFFYSRVVQDMLILNKLAIGCQTMFLENVTSVASVSAHFVEDTIVVYADKYFVLAVVLIAFPATFVGVRVVLEFVLIAVG